MRAHYHRHFRSPNFSRNWNCDFDILTQWPWSLGKNRIYPRSASVTRGAKKICSTVTRILSFSRVYFVSVFSLCSNSLASSSSSLLGIVSRTEFQLVHGSISNSRKVRFSNSIHADFRTFDWLFSAQISIALCRNAHLFSKTALTKL